MIPAVTETFGYDQINRLLNSSIPGVGSKSLTYDAIGNIVSKSDVGGTYLYPASGTARPHAVQSISGGTVNSGAGMGGSITSPTFYYDQNGNVLAAGMQSAGVLTGPGRSVTYTVTNQTATVTYSGGTISYEYDSSDQRYKQSAPGGTTTYWNAQGVTSEEYVAAGSTITEWRNYVVAGDETIGVIKGNTAGATKWGTPTKWGDCCWSAVTFTALYFHDDHLGSVAAITDSAGTVQEHDYYDAWGKRRHADGTDDTSDTMASSIANRGYTTQEQVNEIAWLNLNARMYDPQIGKFMSTDPMVGRPFSTQGWNRYAYVSNNPLRYVDPTGMTASDGTLEEITAYGHKKSGGDGDGLSSISVGGGGPTLIDLGSFNFGFSFTGSSVGTTNGNGKSTCTGDECKNSQNQPCLDDQGKACEEIVGTSPSRPTSKNHDNQLADVTIRVFPKAVAPDIGHAGIGVNTPHTQGFYPDTTKDVKTQIKEGLGRDVPGGVKDDDTEEAGEDSESLTIPTTKEQDEKMQKAIDDRKKNPGKYNLYGRNCAEFCRDVLKAGGVPTPDKMIPDVFWTAPFE